MKASRRTVLAAATGMAALSGCSPAAQQRSATTLTYLESIFFTTLYPPAGGFYPNSGVLNNVTDRLLHQDPRTLELHPWIASELPQVNADSTMCTFRLRPGVTHSDGSPVDAANVVRNFDLYGLGDKTRRLTVSEQINNYQRGEVVDERTVRFHFSKPSPGFAQATSTMNAGLLSNATLQRSLEGFGPGSATSIVGSGPFVISEEELGTRLVLRAREDYDWAPASLAHQGRPRLDEVRFVLAGEDSVRAGALIADQADVARQIEAPVERHLRDKGIDVLAAPTNGVTNQLAFRFTHPLLSDIRVRRAIMAAIDREQIIRVLFSESYPLATSPLAATALGYKDQSGHYHHDPQLSRSLLDEAGWLPQADGIRSRQGRRLALTFSQALPQPRSHEVVTMLQQQLREVGIEVDEYPGDQAAQTAAQNQIELIQVLHTMVGRADHDVIKSQYHSANRNVLLNALADAPAADPELEDLLDKVASSPRAEQRARWSGMAQDLLTERAYVLPLFEEPQVFGIRAEVKGFVTEAVGRPSFYSVHIER